MYILFNNRKTIALKVIEIVKNSKAYNSTVKTLAVITSASVTSLKI